MNSSDLQRNDHIRQNDIPPRYLQLINICRMDCIYDATIVVYYFISKR